jgi:DNA-binding transcriptional ArsR family regulator
MDLTIEHEADDQRRASDGAADLLAALGSPARLAIVRVLAADGPLDVGQLAAKVELSVANCSQHLTRLRAARIVTSRKTGNRVLNSLTNSSIATLVANADGICR